MRPPECKQRTAPKGQARVGCGGGVRPGKPAGSPLAAGCRLRRLLPAEQHGEGPGNDWGAGASEGQAKQWLWSLRSSDGARPHHRTYVRLHRLGSWRSQFESSPTRDGISSHPRGCRHWRLRPAAAGARRGGRAMSLTLREALQQRIKSYVAQAEAACRQAPPAHAGAAPPLSPVAPLESLQKRRRGLASSRCTPRGPVASAPVAPGL